MAVLMMAGNLLGTPIFTEDFGTTQVANGWNGYNNWLYSYGTPPASLSSQRSPSVCGFFSNVLSGNCTNNNRGTISHAIPAQTDYVKLTGTYVAYYANSKDFRIGFYSSKGGAQPESGCSGVSLRVGDGTSYNVSGVSTVAGTSTATPFVTLSSYAGQTNFALEVNLSNTAIEGLAARTAKATWNYGTGSETSTTFAINGSLTSLSYVSIDKSYTTGVAGFDNLVVTAVPEPATIALLCGGVVGILVRSRRRRGI